MRKVVGSPTESGSPAAASGREWCNGLAAAEQASKPVARNCLRSMGVPGDWTERNGIRIWRCLTTKVIGTERRAVFKKARSLDRWRGRSGARRKREFYRSVRPGRSVFSGVRRHGLHILARWGGKSRREPRRPGEAAFSGTIGRSGRRVTSVRRHGLHVLLAGQESQLRIKKAGWNPTGFCVCNSATTIPRCLRPMNRHRLSKANRLPDRSKSAGHQLRDRL